MKNGNPHPALSQGERVKAVDVLKEIADPGNWKVMLMWPGPHKVRIWVGDERILERAKDALEEGKK